MITHVIVELDAPIEEKYWQDDDIFSNEYYGFGKPLIRCKDCKHFTGKWCILNSRKEFDPEDRLVNEEGFCAWAERKSE